MIKLQTVQKEKNLHRLFFKAFSNQTRLEIIFLLVKGPLTVTEICEKTGFEQSRVSHNLKCLEHCGFVEVKQKGIFREYSLDKEIIMPMIKLFDKHVKKYSNKLMNCEAMSNE